MAAAARPVCKRSYGKYLPPRGSVLAITKDDGGEIGA
jgi:hypothetical protein